MMENSMFGSELSLKTGVHRESALMMIALYENVPHD